MMKRILTALLLAPAACDGGGQTGGGGGREDRYNAFAVKFGEAIRSGGAAASYEMTSKSYRAAHTLKEFSAFLQEAEKRYGKATHVGPSINTVKADGPLGENLGFPKDIPVKDRRARMLVRMANGPDAYNDCLYEVWINIIEEDGADRIVTIQIPGINM